VPALLPLHLVIFNELGLLCTEARCGRLLYKAALRRGEGGSVRRPARGFGTPARGRGGTPRARHVFGSGSRCGGCLSPSDSVRRLGGAARGSAQPRVPVALAGGFSSPRCIAMASPARQPLPAHGAAQPSSSGPLPTGPEKTTAPGWPLHAGPLGARSPALPVTGQ